MSAAWIELFGVQCLQDAVGIWQPQSGVLQSLKCADGYVVHDFGDGTRWVQKVGSQEILRRLPSGQCFTSSKEINLNKLRSMSRGLELLLEDREQEAVETNCAVSEATLIPRSLGSNVVYQRQSDGYISATALCRIVGKWPADYTRTSGYKEFAKELSSAMGIPIADLTQVSTSGGAETKGTWVHPDVAIHLAQWCSPKFSVQVSQWVREWLTNKSAGQNSQPFKLPQTYVEALRALADSEEDKCRLQGEVRQIGILKREAIELSQDLLAVRAQEESAIPLSMWLSRTSSEHGHGPISGLRVMRALGLLHRELVKGCRRSKESAVSQKFLDRGWLMYSSSGFIKRKKFNEVAEVVLDSQGAAVTGESRVVMVTTEGTAHLLQWFLSRPETMMRRLIRQRPDSNMHRLRGRYSFMDHDTHAWDELHKTDQANGVRLFQTNSGWSARCEVKSKSTKAMYTVTGTGETLQDALMQLADNYYRGLPVTHAH